MAGPTIRPFLMFEGKAEEAMNFYVSLFSNAAVLDLVRYGPNEASAGLVKRGRFAIGGQTILCTDSTVKHGFSFTPAFSLFVDCDSEGELGRLYAALMAGGAVLMPAGTYGFSQGFAWVNDRYGVSWQLNFA